MGADLRVDEKGIRGRIIPGSCGLIALCWLLAGCATQGEGVTRPLPFHLALAPVAVQVSQAEVPIEEGSETEIVLDFESEPLSAALREALSARFSKVSLLPSTPESDTTRNHDAWLTVAEEEGADLILDATLTFQETIHTELNGYFWANLPLFAIGGPFNWWVADRSYHVNVELEAEVFDVTAAARLRRLTAASSLVEIRSQTQEAALNFTDRGSDVGAYALTIVVPSGLVSAESDEVPDELEAMIAEELCGLLAQEVQERGLDITRELVDFHPEQVGQGADGRYLEGEIVLELGEVDRLSETFRYRLGSGQFADASWSAEEFQPRTDRTPGQRRYSFKVPLDGADSNTVQLEVEQLDSSLSKRTFTYPVRSPRMDP